MGFFDFLTEEIAIDLGTANTLIIHNDKVVVDSPSIVAKDRISGKIIAVGNEANLMQGKTHESINRNHGPMIAKIITPTTPIAFAVKTLPLTN